MVLFRKPNAAAIARFIDAQSGLAFRYESVGATQRQPPTGYVVDHRRVLLGQGEATFARAANAIREWEHFRLGWIELHRRKTAVAPQPGETVAVLARVFSLWFLNACRIVYVVDDDDDGLVSRLGFAYGTLPGHAESGEERFLVEWDRRDDSVWYDILAFSRPNHILVRLAYPQSRKLQKRFARDSAQAMQRAVRE